MSETPQREAEEVPGELWSTTGLKTTVYPYTAQPELRVYAAGKWRRAVVGSKFTFPDGRIAVSCEVPLPDPGLGEAYLHRAYWWSLDRMRVIWDGRAP